MGLGGDRKRAFIILAVSIAVAVTAFVLRPHDSDHPSRVGDRTTSTEPTDALSPTDGSTPKAVAKRTPKATPSAQELGSQGGFAIPMPTLLPPGLAGNGATINAPKHKLTIVWTSPTALGPIAYVIPSSEDHPKGGWVEKTRHRVTLSTTVYGNPDYAVAYVQAGVGAPATCEIFVDGRRTAHRTTEGPYGAVWCQG